MPDTSDPTRNSQEWVCPNCDTASELAAYCARCGERRLTDHDNSLHGLATHWFESVLHVDGRFLRSASDLLLKPGELTDAFRAGRRKRFINPIPLFLAVSIIFFVTQSLTGLNILSVPLETHLHNDLYGEQANAIIKQHLARTRESPETYAADFNKHEQSIAKSAVVIMLPPIALLLALLFMRRERRAPVHVVFGLHFLSFMLLFLALLFPIVAIVLRLGAIVGLHVDWGVADIIISILEVAAVAMYFWCAVRRVYGANRIHQLLATMVLTGFVPLILYGYRMATFWLTVQLT